MVLRLRFGKRFGHITQSHGPVHCLWVVAGVLAWFVRMSSSYSCCAARLPRATDAGSDSKGGCVELRHRPLLPSTDSPRQWRGHEGEAGMLYRCMTACFSSLWVC